MKRFRLLFYSINAWLALLLLLFVFLVIFFVLADRYTPYTSDAYIQATVLQVSPQVDGRVISVFVKNGSKVKKGDKIFQLDPEPYQYQVDRYTANLVLIKANIQQLQDQLEQQQHILAGQEAELVYTKKEYLRYEKLAEQQLSSKDDRDQAYNNYQQAQAQVLSTTDEIQILNSQLSAMIGDENASVKLAEAELASAQYELDKTTFIVPFDGVIDNLQLSIGSYIEADDKVMTVIDTANWWLVANFKENALSIIKEEQPVSFSLFMYPNQVFYSRVDNLGLGNVIGQGYPSGLLPEIKNPMTWITRSKRFQVRIKIEQNLNGKIQRVGASARVLIVPEQAGIMGGIGNFYLKVVSFFDYIY
ncbi:HlyD family secretion protein [uncultured Shewanella sp.]|uniref:HlyD family secretion protein n=1 Tax=uncultured Shewanella sp. TaxID=173975 RepID=UPI002632886F|nr:HlyD family secretion protein [uncultured Shewanella sp.]